MRRLPILFCALALGGLVGPLQASSTRQPAGVITFLSGKVTVYTAAKGEGQPLTLGKQLYAGDEIKTGANGRAAMVLLDGTQLRINYNTDITLKDKNSKGKTGPRGIGAIGVALGELWAKVTHKDSTLEFDTPAAVAAVKGTEPIIGVTPDGRPREGSQVQSLSCPPSRFQAAVFAHFSRYGGTMSERLVRSSSFVLGGRPECPEARQKVARTRP